MQPLFPWFRLHPPARQSERADITVVSKGLTKPELAGWPKAKLKVIDSTRLAASGDIAAETTSGKIQSVLLINYPGCTTPVYRSAEVVLM